MDIEAEIRDLKRRVGELEGSFGFLTRQVQDVHKDLLSFEGRTEASFERVDQRFDSVDGRLDTVESRLDRVDTQVRGLRTDMPKIVADTMREVLREERGRK